MVTDPCEGLASMVCRAKRAEALNYTGTFNRFQKKYFQDHHRFASSIEAAMELESMGIVLENLSYRYTIQVIETAAFFYATPLKYDSTGVVGGIFRIKTPDGKETLLDISCVANRYGTQVKLDPPLLQNGRPTCPPGTSDR